MGIKTDLQNLQSTLIQEIKQYVEKQFQAMTLMKRSDTYFK